MANLFDHAGAPAPGIVLNPEQRAAVHHGEGPLVVVAGAGTGKTRVITERIRYLLDTQPDLTGAEILGLTFTDKAAADAYTTHPMHQALLKWLLPLIDPVELDFEA